MNVKWIFKCKLLDLLLFVPLLVSLSKKKKTTFRQKDVHVSNKTINTQHKSTIANNNLFEKSNQVNKYQ